MKGTAASLGALLLVGLSCPPAPAQYGGPVPYGVPAEYGPMWIGYPRPPAPDACGPGYYALNCCGCPYGPNYCLVPPWAPFNGLRPSPGMPTAPGRPTTPTTPGARVAPPLAGLPPLASLPPLQYAGQGPAPPTGPSFPTHPFARGPRDFFMWTEVSEDQAARLRLPTVVP